MSDDPTTTDDLEGVVDHLDLDDPLDVLDDLDGVHGLDEEWGGLADQLLDDVPDHVWTRAVSEAVDGSADAEAFAGLVPALDEAADVLGDPGAGLDGDDAATGPFDPTDTGAHEDVIDVDDLGTAFDTGTGAESDPASDAGADDHLDGTDGGW